MAIDRFLEAGADIPDELIRAVSNGDATFLCGAGVSFHANLPSFKELTDRVYARLGARPARAWCSSLERYSREQKCRLITDRHPEASIALAAVKKACDEGTPAAARRILTGDPPPQISNRVRIGEDLLVRPGSGARP